MSENNQLEVRTSSERFLNNVQQQFAAETGTPVAFSPYQKQLAQHLFLKLDSVLKDFESKRLDSGKTKQTPYNWHNINIRKLSLDAVHTVQLGLDALIPNHVHPVPYFNSKEKKYDLDLRVGYIGKAYYRTEAAVEKPKDVVIELVYSTDLFKPLKKSMSNKIESYEFEITNPFDRGSIIGGFGYLAFEDPVKNKLIMVSEADFEKSKKAAKSDAFWSKHPVEMRYKTLVHRVTEKLQIDPKKVNASYLHMENKDEETSIRREVNEKANQEVIDVEIEEQYESEEEKEHQEHGKEAPQQPIKQELPRDPQPEVSNNRQQELFDSFEEAEQQQATGTDGLDW